MNLKFSEKYDFVPRFFRQAIANILANVMTPLASLISVIFLGHLDKIDNLAGVTLAGNILSFIFFILTFLRMSTTGVTAQAVGRDDREGILLVGFRNGFLALAIGSLLIMLSYPLGELAFALLNITDEFKASAQTYFNITMLSAPANLLNMVILGWFLGREKNLLVILLSVVGNVAKVVLDYVLIIRWGWESLGAGTSSAISQYLSLFVGLLFVFKEIQWQEVQAIKAKIWQISEIKSSLKFNADILISNFFIIFASLLFNYEGTMMGTMIYTQNALLIQICNLSVYILLGLSFSTETLLGNFKGQKVLDKLFPLAFVSFGSGLFVAVSIGGICWLFPHTIFGLLTNHYELIENIEIYIPWLMLVLLFDAMNFMLDAQFLALAEGSILRNMSMIAIVGFLPMTFVAMKYESNQILWLSLFLFLAIRAIMLGAKLPEKLR
ncbi:guanitoxin biosynthesis MATE family efflux transporter GntT [Crocosphaera sp. XPORK-15E]|uniref:guanitoxin biosynthesis MATE family efflux transporter GntT n=1 Tax=Crocosphaera sp. XPORK-15E TaxID=3110247 RepID=UPI002B21E094|nr:guanitoxin biosynthesis MATE family efflux transporter GntT [Crocosphaera sp. XPORK-15E]MEA5536965.1 guanitoxin biosynthesis MATE family efflux transporter GntT [Crocosphaera sp. XPORK-15E]